MKILNQVPVSVYNVRIRLKPQLIENIWSLFCFCQFMEFVHLRSK